MLANNINIQHGKLNFNISKNIPIYLPYKAFNILKFQYLELA